MSLTSSRAQDYYILRNNVKPGVPKSGYTATKGDLVQRENAQNNEWDLAVNADPGFAGIVESVNSGNGTLSIAELIPGTRLILQHDQVGGPAMGDKVKVQAGAVAKTLGRTVVTTDAGGVGRITALTPRGAGTVEVTF